MAGERSVQLVVITPDREVLNTAADSVVIPSHDGELGVLHERAPLMCELGIGQLRYTLAGQTAAYFIDGGFAQVLHDQVTVLTNRALAASELTPAIVAAAEQAVGTHPSGTLEEREGRERAQARVRVMKRLTNG